MSITANAAINRIWINPPTVYEDTMPNNQRQIKTTKMVHNILAFSFVKIRPRGAVFIKECKLVAKARDV